MTVIDFIAVPFAIPDHSYLGELAEELVPLITERLLDSRSIRRSPKKCLEKGKNMVESGDPDGVCLGSGDTLISARDINNFA